MKRLHLPLGALFVASLLSGTAARATIPAAPGQVQVAWMEYHNEFLVRWTHVASANGYHVYRYDTNMSAWVQVATNLSFDARAVPSFRDPMGTVSPGPGCYSVSAVNVEGEGAVTTASLVPPPGVGSFFNHGGWSKGYTFMRAEFICNAFPGGADGMLEVSLDGINYTQATWNTNIQAMHQLLLTNLAPATVYYGTRITMVASNGIGLSDTFPWGIATLLPSVDTLEDVANEIDLGDYTWIERAQILTPPAHGTLVPYEGLLSRWFYTPEPNFTGSDTVQIIEDLSGTPVTVTLNVQNVNDPPVATPFNITLAEDTPTLIGPAVFDVENDPYTAHYVYGLYDGGGELLTQGTNLLWLPWTNWVGTVQFYFDAWDSEPGPLASGTITVTNINDAPYAESMVWYTPEDVPTDIFVMATDADGDPVTYELVDLPLHGTLSGTAPNFTYTPHPNFNGTDTFTYRAHDQATNGEIALFELTIAAVNDPPTATGQSVTTLEDVPLAITLSGSDIDGDALSYEIVGMPTRGTLSGTAPNLQYTPDADYIGSDTLTFRVSDGITNSQVALVAITVTDAYDGAAPEFVKVAWIDNQSEFLVRWRPVEGATGYNVYRYDTNASVWVQVATNLMFEPWNVLSFREYSYNGAAVGPTTYAVTAVTDDGESVKVSGSVTPGPYDGSYFVLNMEWWPRGYTFIDPQMIGSSLVQLTDGMIEFGPDFNSPFTHGAWNTNFAMGHGFHITNLAMGTVYLPRITAVMENGIGISAASLSTYTLPPPVFNVWEDTANNVEIGDYSWINRAQIHTPPAHGTMTPGAFAHWWTYTPETNFTGTDTFQILDNSNGPPVTVTVNVQNINDPPVTYDFTVYVPEDTQSVFTPPVTDIDSTFYVTMIDTPPLYGWASGWQTTNLIYDPPPNFVGTDEFTYIAADFEWSLPARVTVIVTNVNDEPTSGYQSFTTAEDTPVTFTIAATDLDGDPLTIIITTPPWTGTITNTGLSVTYTPAPDFNGVVGFEFRVSDGQTTSDWVFADINVEAVNDLPIPVNQSLSITTAEDTAVDLSFAGTDAENDPLDFVIVDPPQHGQTFGSAYQPDPDYTGTDTLTFRIFDQTGYSVLCTRTITITPVNDAPVANDKSVSVNEDLSLAITLTGSDVDGDSLTFAIVTPPQHGQFMDGVYTAAANYNGPDSFTYKANDGQLDSALATVSITVAAVNDAPLANNQSVSTPYNTAVNIVLTGSDVEGSALTFTTLSSPANGVLTGTGANRAFTPNIGWSGTTSFTVKVNDGELDSATATVTITVAGPGSIPAAPSGLTATAVSQTQINLAWTDNSSNEDGFKIERATASTGPWTEIGTVGPGVTTYASTGLTKNKRYYYRVRAYNVLGNSAYSNTANAKTLN